MPKKCHHITFSASLTQFLNQVQAVSLECTVDDSALRGCIGDYSVVHPVAAIARTRLWYSGVKT